MKTLKRSLLKDYEIPVRQPSKINCVQFGADLNMLGLIDRLIDDANENGADIGVAAVRLAAGEHCEALAEQDGLYTAFIRGDLREKEVKREQVVQSILRVIDPTADLEALKTLACEEGIEFLLVSRDPNGEYPQRNEHGAAYAALFLRLRMIAGLSMPYVIAVDEDENAATTLRGEILALQPDSNDHAAFSAWLKEEAFLNSLSDSLVSRCTPEEALRQCTRMNYRDSMIVTAEPYALWAIETKDSSLFGLERCPQVRLCSDLRPTLRKKARIFDAGLFAFASMGMLHGDATLSDCMKDEALRDHVGHAFTDEILPLLDESDRDNEYIIACFERYGNPLLDNELAFCAHGMVRRFLRGVLPTVRAYADEHFAPPPRLTAALAALILVYADVRLRGGIYETVIGGIPCPIYDDPEVLKAFSTLASDMPADSLAYAAPADYSIWHTDLREIDGLEQALADNFSERLAKQ